MITDEHVRAVCKLGQGAACCRYLMFGKGFECHKHSQLAAVIDGRVERGEFNARGDNCDGWTETQVVA